MADSDPQPLRPARLWRPRRVLITRGAGDWAHGRAIAERGRRARTAGHRAARGPARSRRHGLCRGQGDAGGGRRAARQAALPADRAVGRLAGRLSRGMPGALQLLLPRGVAQGAAGHPRLRQLARDHRRPAGLRRAGDGDLTLGGARGRGDDVRGVVLYRPARHRASDRLAVGARRPLRGMGCRRPAALHDQVRRRRAAAGGGRQRWPDAGALLAQPGRHRPVRGRHRAGRRPSDGAPANGGRRGTSAG